MKTITFFTACLKMHLNREMAYRFNFIVRTAALLSFDLILPFVTIIIYKWTNGFFGWSFHEILLFQGIYIFINALDRMFLQRIDWNLASGVRTGYFDRYLLIPYNTLAYMSFTNLGLEHIVNMIVGLILIGYSLANNAITITFVNMLIFLLSIIFALMFIFSISLFKYAIIIRAIRVGRLGELVRTIKSYAQYPVDIYNAFLSSVLRYMFPLAIIAYYPSSILLGRAFSNIYIVFVIISVIFLFTLVFWKDTLKHYESAGG